ncbi:MAG TPA: hypothetical protein VGX00_02000 [Thermoplasmata archaeon]|nr:hypothetical protein [Thermoplasmata archaeon]
MLTRLEFDALLRPVSDPGKRIALFGALLARESGLNAKLEVTGGSAMTVYSQSRISSADVDIVGDRRRIVPVLRRWGFIAQEDPEDGRVYWRREDHSLAVDIVRRGRRAGSGRSGTSRVIATEAGDVYLTAIEDLIVRRLVFWSRDGTPALLDHAVLLFLEHSDEIDLDYLEFEVRYEKIDVAYRELRRLAEAAGRK